MKILAVDDEKYALDALTEAIREAEPGAEIAAYISAKEALAYAEVHPCDVAFLDIRLRGTSGLAVALRLKSLRPSVNIIFVTGYDEYLLTAMQQRCSGYLLKPVHAEQVREELDNLRFPLAPERARIHAQTFGNFELFADGEPVAFETPRCKELLAYLIDRRGAFASNAEIAVEIWENNDNTASVQAQVRKAKAALQRSLKDAGISEILRTSRSDMSVDVTKLSCDYWQLLDNDVRVLNSFTGEYMSGYTWAEMTRAALYRRQGE